MVCAISPGPLWGFSRMPVDAVGLEKEMLVLGTGCA